MIFVGHFVLTFCVENDSEHGNFNSIKSSWPQEKLVQQSDDINEHKDEAKCRLDHSSNFLKAFLNRGIWPVIGEGGHRSSQQSIFKW